MEVDAGLPFVGHETLIVEIFTELEEIAQSLKDLVKAINVPKIGEAKANAFAERCQALIVQPNLVGLVNELLAHMDVAIESDDAENMFYLLYALARHLDQESLDSVVAGIINLTSSASAEKAPLSFRILANLYSTVGYSSPSRYAIFLTMVKLVAQHKLKECLSEDLDNIKVLFKQWSSTLEQQQELLKALVGAYAAVGASNVERSALLLYLSLFEVNSPALNSTEEMAAKAALMFINDPFTKSEYSICHLDAVKNLEKLPKYASLHKLLEIFATESLTEFKAFEKANAGYLESLELSPQVCLENMKLLSLVSLANENSNITYSQVAESLEIPLEDVESWMVNAMKKDVVDAKLDQLNNTIVINKGSHRSFTDADWEIMGKKLSQWKSAVKTLLQHVETARAEAAAAH